MPFDDALRIAELRGPNRLCEPTAAPIRFRSVGSSCGLSPECSAPLVGAQDDEKTDAFKAALGDADAEIVSREGGTAILAPLRAVAVDVAVLAKLQAALAIPARLSSHASFQVSADGMGSVVAVGTAAPLTDIAAVQAIAKPDRPQSLGLLPSE